MQLPAEIHYVAIEGVIGAGKTTLARLLSERLGARLVLEKFEENPFLPRFYEDPEHYAFQTQIFFLLSRYRQQQELYQADLFHSHIISDYIFEKDKIFAYLTLRDDELKLYENLLAAIERTIPPPDLIIYLQSSVDRLMENIKKRGREMEKKMSEEYIKELNEAYNYFFFRYKSTPLLIVKTSDIDFVNNQDHFEDLLKQILRPNKAPIEYYIIRSCRNSMIRLLLFSLIPFFIAAFVIYFILTIFKGIMRGFKGSSRTFSRFAQSETPPKPKETYRDVQEAKFVELPNQNKGNQSEQNS